MFDLVVIGGGPAGVTAALRARELGASVALVERGRMGGICTNDGCAPTRVLAKAARLFRDSHQFEEYGLIGERPVVNLPALLSRTQQTVYRLHEKKQLLGHLAGSGVRVFSEVGEARFVDANRVALANGEILSGGKFILCAGGRGRRLPLPGSEHALTHSDVWQMRELPGSLAVVGAAATGCQLASIFADFGTQVTILEAAPRILAAEDEAVSEAMAGSFERQGIAIKTGIAGIERIERHGGSLQLHYVQQGETRQLTAEVIILAVGWVGNVEGLNLEAAGVRHERGYVAVNDCLQTSAAHIYAAGDISGRMMLVQTASSEGRIAAENAILGTNRSLQHTIVPHGGFTDPEYASVGLTEAQARPEQECAVAVVPYADLDRAVIDGRTEGFCKLLVNRQSRQVIGAHVVGEQAVEVVQIVAAAMAAGVQVEQLAELELAYPTFTAIVGLAARQLVRDLELTPLSPEWQALARLRPSEWERRDPDST